MYTRFLTLPSIICDTLLSVIEQLQREGYSRDDIIIYTNKDAATNFGFAGLSGIDVKTGVNGV
ncbi:hypothetical protein EFM36_10300, partial [Limosilactobacillus fermentum]|nr:hypothetical protein [Limosilactobacillus fermentum]